ncbi:hypothetical protein V6N13_138211 [Hibiscus sabdariffa]|uniref:Uncharacterized protein n=1 Tax=Hibiscus sabdariffa TaxID=183260 RepID=A0ABR2QCW2_9ROSI
MGKSKAEISKKERTWNRQQWITMERVVEQSDRLWGFFILVGFPAASLYWPRADIWLGLSPSVVSTICTIPLSNTTHMSYDSKTETPFTLLRPHCWKSLKLLHKSPRPLTPSN